MSLLAVASLGSPGHALRHRPRAGQTPRLVFRILGYEVIALYGDYEEHPYVPGSSPSMIWVLTFPGR
jgi:hypothetical protein